jgi:hypothetical protein
MPGAVARIADVMSTYPAPWALCGGWAVDAWLGRLSREHGDTDVSVFVQDQRALFEHLRGWQLVVHDAIDDGDHARAWDGVRELVHPGHIHARGPEHAGPMPERLDAAAAQTFSLDIQLDDRAGGEWVLHADPRIAVPLAAAVAMSPWGVPVATPEVLLFFKSRDLRRRDHADFRALLPTLSAEQRAWLREAVAALGHPWSKELASRVRG